MCTVLRPGSDCRSTHSADAVCSSRLNCSVYIQRDRNMPAHCAMYACKNRYVAESTVKFCCQKIQLSIVWNVPLLIHIPSSAGTSGSTTWAFYSTV